jgi:dTDP-L-rhamnose 4-epimerase
MTLSVLITGGAGFIGSHLANRLLVEGHRVRVLDNLNPQVHGEGGRRPTYLPPEIELVVGDVRDKRAVERSLDGVDAVFHLAALVGVGQSMYQPREYTSVNGVGTALLLEVLLRRPIERLVVASSMSIYGEGRYLDGSERVVDDAQRDPTDLASQRWEPRATNGEPLVPVPTPEDKAPRLESIYALSKYDQERMCLMMGNAYRIPTVALRFFNVYGTRQALSNPYTGVMAIFASRLLNDKAPLIFEDGHQRRDFVSVHDVAQACVKALTRPEAVGQSFNVGSGQSRTIRDVAEAMGRALSRRVDPEVTGRYRVGDIRHCFADIGRARRLLGYEPTVSFDDGVAELVDWLREQRPVDRVEQAHRELAQRGLTL